MDIPATLHDSHVAIGNEGDLLGTFRPEIIILHNHQLITTTEFILTVEHLITDALVIDVRPFVAARDDDGLIQTYTTVTRGQRLHQFVAWNTDYISKALETDFREDWNHIIPDLRRIPQDTRCLTLTEHLIQIALIDLDTIAAQHISHQCRTLLLAYGWQLGFVAYEQHTAVLSTVHELHQIVKQIATAKG